MAGGRPTTYNQEMLDKCREYLDTYEELGEVIPSVVGLCRHIRRAKSTVYKWADEPDKEEFSDILKEIEEVQHIVLANSGLAGTFNPTITKLMLTKHGYSDRVENDLKSSDGSMSPQEIKVTIVSPDD